MLCSNSLRADEGKAAFSRHYFIRDAQWWEAHPVVTLWTAIDKQEEGHKAMVQRNTTVSIGKGAINPST